MSALQVLGALLIAAPFVAIAVVFTHLVGWRATAAIYGLTALLVAVVGAGAFLIGGQP